MNSRSKNLVFWVVIGLFMILLFSLLNAPQRVPVQEVAFVTLFQNWNREKYAKLL